MADSESVHLNSLREQVPMAKHCTVMATTAIADPLRCYSVGYPGPARIGDGLH